ncbi:MAG: hypothetical protein JOZ53_10910 [Planctomycetaceae bacterium]|nr:hypothetical protein [Planctomycetaceae bacterium]
MLEAPVSNGCFNQLYSLRVGRQEFLKNFQKSWPAKQTISALNLLHILLGTSTFIACETGESTMPRGDKSAYTDKQKRQAEHIEESYEERGVPEEEAERRAWATVNKQSGGGKKSGSGRKKSK